MEGRPGLAQRDCIGKRVREKLTFFFLESCGSWTWADVVSDEREIQLLSRSTTGLGLKRFKR